MTRHQMNVKLLSIAGLVSLSVGNNSITGALDQATFPTLFTNLAKLDIHGCRRVNGTFPAWLHPTLAVLNASSCSLQGPLPQNFSSLPSLSAVDIHDNYFTGILLCICVPFLWHFCAMWDLQIIPQFKISVFKISYVVRTQNSMLCYSSTYPIPEIPFPLWPWAGYCFLVCAETPLQNMPTPETLTWVCCSLSRDAACWVVICNYGQKH